MNQVVERDFEARSSLLGSANSWNGLRLLPSPRESVIGSAKPSWIVTWATRLRLPLFVPVGNDARFPRQSVGTEAFAPFKTKITAGRRFVGDSSRRS